MLDEDDRSAAQTRSNNCSNADQIHAVMDENDIVFSDPAD
jgi:hypothetical protein